MQAGLLCSTCLGSKLTQNINHKVLDKDVSSERQFPSPLILELCRVGLESTRLQHAVFSSRHLDHHSTRAKLIGSKIMFCFCFDSLVAQVLN